MHPLPPLLGLLALYAAVVIAPGPNFAVVSQLALKGRNRSALEATLGVAIGSACYAALSMIGVRALSAASALLSTLGLAGGAYLVWSGVKLARASQSHRPPPRPSRERAGGLGAGLRVSLSNPKAIVFFASLYAAALPPRVPPALMAGALLGGVLIELTWYGLVSVAFGSPPARRAYLRWAPLIDGATGLAVFAAGLFLILKALASVLA